MLLGLVLSQMDSNAPIVYQPYPGSALSIRITVLHAMSGKRSQMDVPITQTLCHLKQQIASQLNARSSDLAIVFQSQLVGDDDSETSVYDFGLGNGSVLQVALQVRYEEVVVYVAYWDSLFWPLRRAEYSFRFKVPQNIPCAALIKAEVMRICDGEWCDELRCAQRMTDPHLFLTNDSWTRIDCGFTVISLGDDHSLDELADEFNPYEVYVIDPMFCRCGICDLSWMLHEWYCPQLWHSAALAHHTEAIASSSSSGCLSTSSLEL